MNITFNFDTDQERQTVLSALAKRFNKETSDLDGIEVDLKGFLLGNVRNLFVTNKVSLVDSSKLTDEQKTARATLIKDTKASADIIFSGAKFLKLFDKYKPNKVITSGVI